MTWGDAFGRSVKVFFIYLGVMISGGIIIGIGFAITGASIFADGGGTASGFTAFIGFLFILAGYLWIFFGGITIFIKLLSDITSETVSENFYRTSEMMRSLVEETRR